MDWLLFRLVGLEEPESHVKNGVNKTPVFTVPVCSAYSPITTSTQHPLDRAMPSRHARNISKPCNIISPDWSGPAALLGSFAEVSSPQKSAKTARPSANTPATELLEIDVTSSSGGLGTVSSCRRSPRIGTCIVGQSAPTTGVLLPLESCLDIVPARRSSLILPSKGGKLVKARKKSPAVGKNEKQECEHKFVSQRSPRREGLRGETVVAVAGSGLTSCGGAVASQLTAVVAEEDTSLQTSATPTSGIVLNSHCRINPVPEFIDPRFRENKPKALVFSHWKRAFWACFLENWVYNSGHWSRWKEVLL